MLFNAIRPTHGSNQRKPLPFVLLTVLIFLGNLLLFDEIVAQTNAQREGDGVSTPALPQDNRTIRGKVLACSDVSCSNSPVPGATVRARSFEDRTAADMKTDENGNFEVVRTKNIPVYVEVVTSDGKFGKIVIVQPNENEITVALEPTAMIRGKIMDRRNTTPPAGRTVTYSIHVPGERGTFMPSFQREVKTNENGEYAFFNIPTGIECHVNLPTYDYGEERSRGASYIARDIKLLPGVGHTLKDYAFDSRPNGSNEYFFQVYNAYNDFESRSRGKNLIENRFDVLFERAKRDGKGVFVIFVRDNVEGEGDGNKLKELMSIYETLFKDDDMFAKTERFYMMCVRMQPKEEQWRILTANMAKDFAAQRKIDAAALPSLFSFAFFDKDGKLRHVEPFDHTAPAGKQKQDLIEMLKKY